MCRTEKQKRNVLKKNPKKLLKRLFIKKNKNKNKTKVVNKAKISLCYQLVNERAQKNETSVRKSNEKTEVTSSIRVK